jgi:transcriptional regulator with XRE-family HTH domain
VGERIDQVVGAAVRTRRKALGLSQEALGDLAGLHRTYVGAIERAEQSITLTVLAQLAVALGCTPSDLVGGA